MINDTNKQSWCVNAFYGMSANNDGSTKMCCMIKRSYTDCDTINWNLSANSIKDNFNNPQALAIRENLQSGVRDPQCQLCWEEEDGGRKSKRLRDNDKYIHAIQYENLPEFTGLAKIELNLGNTCNIRCRTCHPAISSGWIKEDYELNNTHITFKDYGLRMRKYHQTYDEDSSFWADLTENLDTIKQFDFYGGEPLMSKKMWEILRICVERGYARDIELHYNTNGTVWPDDVDIWQHFKSVNISFSIDGIKERFEYMRFPADWEEVKANMKKAIDFNTEHNNLYLSWCMTLSSLNIYYLPELLDEYYNNWTSMGFYLNLVHNPQHFNISKMSPQAKEAVCEQLNNIPKEYTNAWFQIPGIMGFMMAGEHDTGAWETMLALLDKHDNYRKQRYEKTFPEFSKVIR